MPEVFLLHVLVQGKEALAYLHHGLRYVGKGQYTKDPEHLPLVQADIKEEQCLLTWDVFPLPEVKLADFGTTKFTGEKDQRGLAGTLCFHAPEDVAFYGDLQPTAENAWAFDAMIDARITAPDIYAFRVDDVHVRVQRRGLQASASNSRIRHSRAAGVDLEDAGN
ncbi:hypothetical protein CERZMDRAFT_101256 [Cercospora zeae-maydis SCOH1-5]|uniref:Protein kinase domain-containing protein n=1 Tax=Cercospora zeae-maydis SCOH1-5 TaxID=717836 RepID=A0A6A6F7R8_9PEZI|nr:hypothetical protein CERZMDRAFT_101256 [Cercospora zeae-maydis SCOH1-5]